MCVCVSVCAGACVCVRESVYECLRETERKREVVCHFVLEQLLLNLACVDFLEQKEALVKMSLRSLHRDRHGCAGKALACSLQSLPLRRD